ncbi:hypothetical protein KO495_11605 [Colwellia sp. D2M02]|uniref:hypothetical protein n=1 Tax=Colwellia sp. D2M02 TaxID=2841562 RepID=UPI001C08F265|nr:hypothetical protein [Colwellia sp. D2M02]MBU2893962.1 hypothetical protein [Colwellia sp. D2M02]
MTIFDEILMFANQLANDGKKPTVALVKAKLSQPVPLPTLIKTLKSWQHDPKFIAPPAQTTPQENKKHENDDATSNAILEERIQISINKALSHELTQIREELSEMKQMIAELTKELK